MSFVLKEIMVRAVIHVILVQRATDAQARTGRHQIAHTRVASVGGVGGVMHGHGVVVAATLPVVDQGDAVGDVVVGQRRQVGGDVGERAAPDVEHDFSGKEAAPGGRRVWRIRQDFRHLPLRPMFTQIIDLPWPVHALPLNPDTRPHHQPLDRVGPMDPPPHQRQFAEKASNGVD